MRCAAASQVENTYETFSSYRAWRPPLSLCVRLYHAAQRVIECLHLLWSGQHTCSDTSIKIVCEATENIIKYYDNYIICYRNEVPATSLLDVSFSTLTHVAWLGINPAVRQQESVV